MVSFTDGLNYVVYKNPVSQLTISTVGELLRATVSYSNETSMANTLFRRNILLLFTNSVPNSRPILYAKGLKSATPSRSVATKAVVQATVPLTKFYVPHYWLVRVAGISGAAAVCLAAYGRHSLKKADKNQEYLPIYESANQMHFIHSLALVTAPMTRRPALVSVMGGHLHEK